MSSTILLNNEFFNVSYNSTVASTNTEEFVGKQDGITVVYALGTGSQRYINDAQIRLYPNNELTFSIKTGNLTEISFTLAKSSSNQLLASSGKVEDVKWTGKGKSVTFTAGGSSGHLQLTKAEVKVETDNTGITGILEYPVVVTHPVLYTLQGKRVQNHGKGFYILYDGKNVRKVLCK